MKTKKMFAMFAAAAMMLTTSCSNDETFEQFDQLGNEAQVTFSLGLENGMNTRAISDGRGINQLYYAVIDNEKAVIDSENKVIIEKWNQQVDDFQLSLVKGKEYTVVFWAWDKDCKAYTVDKGIVTIDYSKIANNYEDSDAFFKKATFTVTGDESISIVLKRAFAQLNVGVSTREWNNAVTQGTKITKSAVTIKQAATTLDLMTGIASGPEDITLEAANLPGGEKGAKDEEFLRVDTDLNGAMEEYTYLSMCYFLVNDESDGASKTTLDGLNFTFTTEGGQTIELGQGLTNVPVQRNHRTNILSIAGNGALITGDVEVKVTLDPLYDGEHTETSPNVWETNAGIFTEEALAGNTIEMPKGWYIRNGYILEPMPENWTTNPNGIDGTYVIYENSYTLDGKNNTVTFEPYEYHFVAKNAFAATNGKLVTVKDLTFAGEHFGVFGGVYGATDFNTQFVNVTIENNGIYCYNTNGNIPMSVFSALGTATLDNCTIKGTYWVGEKDQNPNAQSAKNNYGCYDIFVPNAGIITINNSTIGSINVQNHGKLTIGSGSTVDLIEAKTPVQAKITINEGAKVTLLNVNQYSDSYAPIVNIEKGAIIETLDLNSIAKTSKISIDNEAEITTIIWNKKEYTSIADFKTAAGL